MQEIFDALASDPQDWSLRCSLCQRLREAGDLNQAAVVMAAAPEIPGNEESILFAASILGASDPHAGVKLIDQFLDMGEVSSSLVNLREELTSRVRSSAGKATETNPERFQDDSASDFLIGPASSISVAARASSSNDKFGAIATALLVHVALIILLMVYHVAIPQPEPPQITISSLVPPSEEVIENETMVLKKKEAAAAATSKPVVTTTGFSSLSLEANLDAHSDLALMSLPSMNMGFGMSMTGFGDVTNMAKIPPGMKSRCSMAERMRRLREGGGEERAETAVRNGLKFLATKQHPEKGHFGDHYTAGMTGLALLAFLGHCETPESPRFGDAVVNAALFLMERSQKNSGKMTNGTRGHHEAYEHAIATYALCELYSMTKESGREIPKLESVLRKAVAIIVSEQTGMGGWPYLGKDIEDMSVSGWNIQALKAAHNTGRKFARVETALDRAMERYLPRIQDDAGAFKYNPDHPSGRTSLTGAALLGMQMWNATKTDTFAKGFDYLVGKTKNPSPGGDFYAPYYNTQVFFLAEGVAWENYNRIFQPRLLDAQNEDGSWLNDNNPREDHQIMNTAWAILMLEVYYRYLPTTDKVDGLETANG